MASFVPSGNAAMMPGPGSLASDTPMKKTASARKIPVPSGKGSVTKSSKKRTWPGKDAPASVNYRREFANL